MSRGEKLVYLLAATLGAVFGGQFGGLPGIFGAFAMVGTVGFADMLLEFHQMDKDTGGRSSHQPS